MRPIFVNSATILAPARAVTRKGGWARIPLRVRYGFFEHPTLGPTLIDTGYTQRCYQGAHRGALLRLYTTVFRAKLIASGQPEAFLARRGLTPTDIQTVIITHFHPDHISGLHLFENARVIGVRDALEKTRRASPLTNARHGVFAELAPPSVDTRFEDITTLHRVPLPHGLGEGVDLAGDQSVIAVPLPGHAEGHFGLYFAQLATPLLYACDATWVIDALDPRIGEGLLGALVPNQPDDAAFTINRLAAFKQAGGLVMTCHDPAPTPFDEENS